MALIERLMHLDPDPARNMAVHSFFAALSEMVAGQLTGQQIQNYYAMTAEDLADWNAVSALMPVANRPAERALFLEHIHAALILAESRAPTYSTPAEVRARLGI